MPDKFDVTGVRQMMDTAHAKVLAIESDARAGNPIDPMRAISAVLESTIAQHDALVLLMNPDMHIQGMDKD